MENSFQTILQVTLFCVFQDDRLLSVKEQNFFGYLCDDSTVTNPHLLFSGQIVAIFSVLLLAIGYIKTEPKAASARVFGVMSVFIVCYLVNGMSAPHLDPSFRLELGLLAYFFSVAMNTVPGLFMIYCFLIFQEKRQIPGILLILFAFHVLLEIALTILEINREDTATTSSIMLFTNLLEAMELVFVGLAIYWTLRGWRGDLVADRRALRWFIISVQGGLIFLVVLVENFVYGFGTEQYAKAQTVIIFSVAVLAFSMLVAAMRFDLVSLSYVIRKVTALSEEPETEESSKFSVDTFNKVFDNGKLYREAGLTIAMLAKKLNLPEYRLRAFIHKQLGFRNFNAMLHQYRIEEASKVLAEKDKQQVPVLTIALSVGYQSITPFNNAFRQIKGVTPSEYRKKKNPS